MARSRDLKVIISGDAKGLNRAFAQAERGAGAMEARIGRASGAVGRHMATAAKVGAAAFGVGLVGALKGSIDAFQEAEKVAAQTDAVLKSTGGAANVTAKQVSDLATAISRKSGMDDEAIQSGENLLLTFTNLRNEQGKGNDIFDQTTRIMADMSTALGQDTKSSAIQLGKALNDPIKGVTALQRVGVSFTKDQKKQIETLVESGKKMDAQKLILGELKTEFGGSAEAAGNTFAGKINKAKVAVGNLGEAIGGALAPALATAADALADFVTDLITSDRPARFFAGIKGAADDAKDAISGIFTGISDRRAAGASLGQAIGGEFADAVSKVDWSKIGQVISTGLGAALKGGDAVARSVAAGISEAMSRVDGRKALGRLLEVIGEALDALFSPSFWAEHFREIFSIVTFVIPVGKILKIPGFATLFRFISAPLFRAVAAVGRGLFDLFGRLGSRAFTEFLAELEKIAPRTAKLLLGLVTDVPRFLRGLPGALRRAAGSGVAALLNRLDDAVGGASRLATRTVAAIVRPFGRLGHNIANAVRGILGDLTAFFGRVGKAIVKAIADAIRSAPKEIVDAIKSIVPGKVRGAVDKITGILRQTGGIVPGSGRGDIVPAMLEPGEFVVRRRVVEQFGPTFFAALNGNTTPGPAGRFQNGGPVAHAAGRRYSAAQLAALWIRAGGSRSQADLMAAIALAESGGDPGISNPTSGAAGLWQIHPPEPGSFDPLTNARIAVRKLRTQGLGAWEVYTNGSYRQFLGRSGSGSGALPAGTPGRRPLGPSTARLGPIVSRVPKGLGGRRLPKSRDSAHDPFFTPTYKPTQEQIDVLTGDPQTNPKSRTARIFQLAVRRNTIIDDLTSGKVKTQATKDRLINELAGINSELDSLTAAPEGLAAIPGAEAYLGSLDRDAALAELTPDTADDKEVARRLLTARRDILAYMQSHPGFTDTDIAQAARDVKSAQDVVDQGDTATTQLADAIRDFAEQMRRQNDFHDRVEGANGTEAVKFMTDVISGELGPRVALRALTPGTGARAAY